MMVESPALIIAIIVTILPLSNSTPHPPHRRKYNARTSLMTNKNINKQTLSSKQK